MTRVMAAVAAVLLLAACGPDGEGAEPAPEDRGFGDGPVAAVLAGEDVAWVVTTVLGAEEPRDELWRFGADGQVSLVATLDGEVRSHLAAVEGGVAVLVERCHAPGDPPGDLDTCRDRSGFVEVFGRSGEHRSTVELWRGAERQGLRVVGVAGDQLWVSGDELQLVDPGGEITARAPRSPGEPCVVDDELVNLTSRAAQAAVEDRGDGAPPTIVVEGGGAQDTFTVQRWDGARWSDVDGGEVEARGGTTLTAGCVDRGYEVWAGASEDAPLHFWDGEGWHDLPTAAVEEELYEAVGITRASDGAALGIDAAGNVLRREAGSTTFEPTGLDIGQVPDPGRPPPSVVIDRSDTLAVICTTTDEGRSTCEVTQP